MPYDAAGFKSWIDFALAWTAKAEKAPKPVKKRAKPTARKGPRRA